MDKVRLYLGEIDKNTRFPKFYSGETTLFYVEGYYKEKNKYLLIEVKDKYINVTYKGLKHQDIPLKYIPISQIQDFIIKVIVVKGDLRKQKNSHQRYGVHFHTAFEPVLIFNKDRFRQYIKRNINNLNRFEYEVDIRYTTEWTVS